MKRTMKEVRQVIVDIIKRSPAYTPRSSAAVTRQEQLREQRLNEFAEDGFLGLSIDFGDEHAIWANKCNLNINSKCEPSISWSSTGRSPAMARVALKVYGEACDLADQIQAVLDCSTIVDEKKP